ncbi:hypothetical protein TUST1-10_00525 [Vibrio phage ICP1_2004_A]|nr:hypothetical protein TUST1-10_00525 [Vibrio phage ICP1_2004_A]
MKDMEYRLVFETCVASNPDRFLGGDWYEGILPLSRLRVLDGGDLEVNVYNTKLSCYISCVLGRVIDSETLSIKNRHIRDCNVIVDFLSEYPEGRFELDGKVKSLVIKHMRNFIKKSGYIIFENQCFNHSNLYDGVDIIGLRD